MMLRIPYYLENEITESDEIVSLNAPAALCYPDTFSGTDFRYKLSHYQGHSATGTIR